MLTNKVKNKLNMLQQALITKEEMGQFDNIKIKFYLSKRLKRQAIQWEIFATHTSYFKKIFYKSLQINKKEQTIQYKKSRNLSTHATT